MTTLFRELVAPAVRTWLTKPSSSLEGTITMVSEKRLLGLLLAGAAFAWLPGETASAQNPPPPDHPSVTVHGQTFTPRTILSRNMGTPQDQETQFPPHKVIGNIYYVGTKTLSS